MDTMTNNTHPKLLLLLGLEDEIVYPERHITPPIDIPTNSDKSIFVFNRDIVSTFEPARDTVQSTHSLINCRSVLLDNIDTVFIESVDRVRTIEGNTLDLIEYTRSTDSGITVENAVRRMYENLGINLEQNYYGMLLTKPETLSEHATYRIVGSNNVPRPSSLPPCPQDRARWQGRRSRHNNVLFEHNNECVEIPMSIIPNSRIHYNLNHLGYLYISNPMINITENFNYRRYVLTTRYAFDLRNVECSLSGITNI